MSRYLNRISGVIPFTHKNIDILLNGKNLIITGTNGSGKTSLLQEVHAKIIFLIINKKQADLPMIISEYKKTVSILETCEKGTSNYTSIKNMMDSYKSDLDRINNGLQIDISEYIDFSSKYDDNIAIVKLFEASRIAKISYTGTIKSLERAIEEATNVGGINHYTNLGKILEDHLLNLKTRRSLAVTEENNNKLAEKIHNWFIHFEKNLKLLMEDDSTSLDFNSDKLKFSIQQDGKPPYTFQTLSSGYSSIFDIYADLLMRTEYFKVTPDELSGIAFIDEIDAHLHVSLQRIIFKFLTESFPNVQFIVTTHSPFVLMSVTDAVIFDVSRNEQIDENLSLYSYTSVIEGLLGTKTNSSSLNDLILEISQLVNAKFKDYVRLTELVDKLSPLEDKLDSRAKAFYLMGVNALLDRE